MKLLPKFFCAFFIFLSFSLTAQKNISLTSLNGNIVFSFKLTNKTPMYSVSFKGKTLVDYSSLGLNFDNGNFNNNLKLNKPVYRDATEDYELVVGKTKKVRSHYKEVSIPLEEITAPFRKINIVVRIFDDGLAFRYDIPKQKNWSAYTMLDENTTFKITGDPKVHTLFLPNYTTSHEG